MQFWAALEAASAGNTPVAMQGYGELNQRTFQSSSALVSLPDFENEQEVILTKQLLKCSIIYVRSTSY